MNINTVIEHLGTSRVELFQHYMRYKNARDAGMDSYHAASRAFDLSDHHREFIFFFILGISRVEQEIEILKELSHGQN